MKAESYNSIIEKISNPDTLAEGLVDLKTALGADEADYKKLEESNATLRDTNARLALRITEPVTQKEPETKEPTKEEVWAQYKETLINNMKEDDNG